MIQTKITEPDKVPNVADGDSGPRVNFVWQVDLQIDDVGEDPRVGDQIEYLEGRYSGQTWRVSDVPIDGLDPPVFTVEVTRQL